MASESLGSAHVLKGAAKTSSDNEEALKKQVAQLQKYISVLIKGMNLVHGTPVLTAEEEQMSDEQLKQVLATVNQMSDNCLCLYSAEEYRMQQVKGAESIKNQYLAMQQANSGVSSPSADKRLWLKEQICKWKTVYIATEMATKSIGNEISALQTPTLEMPCLKRARTDH
jgi:hypothetical protein